MPGARSKAYPAIPLGEAVEKLTQLSKKLGSSPSYNKETFAQGMGYNGSNNGAFQRSVAALMQYELIQKSGSTYVLTDHAQKVLFPNTSEDRVEAIRKAAISPSVFDQLYNAYKGQDLPDLLPNILVTNYGILPGAKDKVVSVFRASLDFAGLLDGNKLRDDSSARPTNPAGKNEAGSSMNKNEPEAKGEDINLHSDVPLTSLTKDFGEGRVAKLSIPSDLSADERHKLVTLIENM